MNGATPGLLSGGVAGSNPARGSYVGRLGMSGVPGPTARRAGCGDRYDIGPAVRLEKKKRKRPLKRVEGKFSGVVVQLST